MFNIEFFPLGEVEESKFTRVVVMVKHNGNWLFCRKFNKETWEIPGGHIEEGESWLEAAERELYEETGITKSKITPVCIYKISSYALLCVADVVEMGTLPQSEIEEVKEFTSLPENLSYPDTHGKMYEKVISFLNNN